MDINLSTLYVDLIKERKEIFPPSESWNFISYTSWKFWADEEQTVENVPAEHL